jgi:hypothetical protein
MVLRWLSLAFDEASKTFRKLRGYQGMPKLVAGSALTTPSSSPSPLTAPREPRSRMYTATQIQQGTGSRPRERIGTPTTNVCASR